jgi:Flp pilus assembly protein TadB
VGKFRGWHILAGIAAMVLTGILGTVMGLNNTAAFMASCVAFVAVALWTDSRISRRRRTARATAPDALREAARPPAPRPDSEQDSALRDDR